MKIYPYAALLSFHAIATPLAAQDQATESEAYESDPLLIPQPGEVKITVTATGMRRLVVNAPQAITIFDLDTIERSQTTDVISLLERSAGVTVARNGPRGGFATVRVRGAEAEQLVVLHDGVRVSDPAAPAGGYDFSNLGLGGIGKVELLRGANSLIWGSDAVGGVLSVETHKGSYGLWLNAEYGSYDSRSVNAAFLENIGPANISISGGWNKSDGFSSFDGGGEADGYEQAFAQGRAVVKASDRLKLVLSGRYADSRAEQDGFPFPLFAFADTLEYQDTLQYSGYAGAEYDAGGARLQGGYAISKTKRDSFDPAFGSAPSFSSEGRLERLTLKGEFDIADAVKLNAGLDSEDSFYETAPFGSSGRTGLDSVHALITFETEGLLLSGGARVDDHQQFGTVWTIGANASYAIDEFLLRASYGEGFKAPSLFQLLSDFGNAALKPETSRSYDVGIVYSDVLRAGDVRAALTLFRRDSRNLIDFISCFGVTALICTNRPFGTYDNIGRTKAQGLELEAAVDVEQFSLQAAYSYIDSKNRSIGAANFGNALARRPKHALTLSSDWYLGERDTGIVGFAKGLNLGADVRLVGDSFDNAANSTRLDGYVLVTARATFPISERIEVYGRMENLFDVNYQTVSTYGTAGRTGTIGVRARF
jgi:vitamin B12 transporter